MSDPWDYKVEIDAPADDTPCTCGDCGWKGPYADLEQIEHCMLTPGDPSPAGRCPKCGTLAYVDMDEMCCLVTGDPISGLSIIGPFDCPEDAQRFAERHRFEGSWWITQLEPPVE